MSKLSTFQRTRQDALARELMSELHGLDLFGYIEAC